MSSANRWKVIQFFTRNLIPTPESSNRCGEMGFYCFYKVSTAIETHFSISEQYS